MISQGRNMKISSATRCARKNHVVKTTCIAVVPPCAQLVSVLAGVMRQPRSDVRASPMSSKELGPEWILSNGSAEAGSSAVRNEDELIAIARRIWPRIQAHAIKEVKNRNFDEKVALAAEVWERVLQSVSKTLRRRGLKESGIVDLEAYLVGVFYHRFNRTLRKERRRQETIKLVPSTRDLERLPAALDLNAQRDLERSVQAKEAIENMDDWVRRLWTEHQYGYSWREIGKRRGLSEDQVKLRFQYALRKLRDRLGP